MRGVTFLNANLMGRVLLATGLGNTGLGAVLGVSRRTISRSTNGGTNFSRDAVVKLVAVVFSEDRDLAAELATAAGSTLVALGLESPPPPPPAPSPAPAPAPPPPPPPHPRLVDSVVCAAADLLNVPPQSARPVLYAAFSRAREIGLSLEMLEEELAPPKSPTPPTTRKAALKK